VGKKQKTEDEKTDVPCHVVEGKFQQIRFTTVKYISSRKNHIYIVSITLYGGKNNSRKEVNQYFRKI
jgi:hypothetical protein